MDIKWTNKNVKNLGIFFGNDNPALATFNTIIPEVKKKLAYWKQFTLSKIGKARVLETFIASKLIYALKFYPIPTSMQKDLQKSMIEFVNFPQNVQTISQEEMWKTCEYGGIKLVNIKIKSGTSKAKWLVDLATNENFKLNLDIFATLLGTQKGGINGRDIFFLLKSYFQNHLKTESKFYKEALLSLAQLEIKKGIQDIHAWDHEHIFFNPIFLTEQGKTLIITKHCEQNKVYKLDQLLEEKVKENFKSPFNKILTNMLTKIKISTSVPKEDTFVKSNGE